MLHVGNTFDSGASLVFPLVVVSASRSLSPPHVIAAGASAGVVVFMLGCFHDYTVLCLVELMASATCNLLWYCENSRGSSLGEYVLAFSTLANLIVE